MAAQASRSGAGARVAAVGPLRAPLLDPHPPGLPFHTGPLAWTRIWDPGAATAVDLPLSCRGAVVLEVDGVACGVRVWPPYRWPLPPGRGPRRLRVHGTLLPLFTGTRWDDATATATAVPVVGGAGEGVGRGNPLLNGRRRWFARSGGSVVGDPRRAVRAGGPDPP